MPAHHSHTPQPCTPKYYPHEQEVRIGNKASRSTPPLHLGWNVTDMTLTDHLFPCSPSPTSYNWEDQKETREERQGRAESAVTPPVSEAEYYPIPTLPTFNKNLPPRPHWAASFSEAPALTSRAQTITLINLLCFAKSVCHALGSG